MSTFDKTSPESLLKHWKLLIGKTIWEMIDGANPELKSWNKWWIGQLIEKYHFGQEPNNHPEPDFPKAWVELKATPIRRLKKKKNISAKERLVLNKINFQTLVEENWDNSSFLKKNSIILLAVYLFEEEKTRLDYLIKIVELLRIHSQIEDLNIIKNDWLKIQQKIQDGKAHELSGMRYYVPWCLYKVSNSERINDESAIFRYSSKRKSFFVQNKLYEPCT